jgi:hypothetical protein
MVAEREDRIWGKYYVNEETGRTAWRKEELLSSDLQMQDSIMSRVAADGQPYFFNFKTGKGARTLAEALADDASVEPAFSLKKTHKTAAWEARWAAASAWEKPKPTTAKISLAKFPAANAEAGASRTKGTRAKSAKTGPKKSWEISQEERAAKTITAFCKGVLARLSGLQYTRQFDSTKRFGMVIHWLKVEDVGEDSQAEMLRVIPGSEVVKCNGIRLKNDMELGMMIKMAKGRPLTMTFIAPGSRRGSAEENKAAVKISMFLRRVANRKKGIEYELEFKDGPLGLEVQKCIVDHVMPRSQGERLGVSVNSLIISINRCSSSTVCTILTLVQYAPY